MQITTGNAMPLGATISNGKINFSVYSSHAEEVELHLLSRGTRERLHVIPLDGKINRTGNIWHVAIMEGPKDFFYGWHIKSADSNTELLLDPYAKAVSNDMPPLGSVYINDNQSQSDASVALPFDWEGITSPNHKQEDLILYEMHVKGFTADPSSEVKNPGTFKGIIEKIPYLRDLGVNAVELLPIHRFMKELSINPTTGEEQYNFWGYSTINYFSLENSYCCKPSAPEEGIQEFKNLVKELHRNDIEVILDVVFNHTSEGNEQGEIQSYKGLANETYYLFDSENGYYNFSGCGNTFNCNHPIVVDLIIDALRFWVLEMHVDGFRFDLASTFYRGDQGAKLATSTIVEAISKDPILATVKLIAEPWDMGLYQVGSFYHEKNRWSEWNDQYRDTVRSFIKGTAPNEAFATRISGSEDIYGERGPNTSINFITAHDGFTLRDLVSYNSKHNEANGEENRDGINDNESWNCGFEGPTDDTNVLALRDRQMRNFHLAMMVSQGIPMLLMGDEYGHTKLGNNNTWNQDNALNWFLWTKLQENQTFYRFYRRLIDFRKNHKHFKKDTYLTDTDLTWHGRTPNNPEWSGPSNLIAFTLNDEDSSLYIALNPSHEEISVQLPEPKEGKRWMWIANTGNVSPKDFYDTPEAVDGLTVAMIPYSSLLLKEES